VDPLTKVLTHVGSCATTLPNRVVKSYDDLVDHCCDAWNKLVEQSLRGMSALAGAAAMLPIVSLDWCMAGLHAHDLEARTSGSADRRRRW
jgi:hypothetical protein